MPQWQDKAGLYIPKSTIADFQVSPRVVPSFFDFLRSLKADSGQELAFQTLDPKARSNLTGFLRDELNEG